MELTQVLKEANVNVETTLQRFASNQSLLTRFLKKFPQDPTYSQLIQAVERFDPEEMQMLAHTLKGMSANLGFEELSVRSDRLVRALRDGIRDKAALLPMVDGITEEYQSLVDLILRLD